MQSLTLSEYQTRRGVELSVDEVAALQGIRSAIGLAPALDLQGTFDLTASSWVGVINLETLTLEIRPKVPLDRLLFMISYSLDRPSWRETVAELQRDDTLVEAMALAFATQVRRATHRGLLQDYRSEEDALAVVRGRLRFDEQLRRHYARYPPVEVRFDEFTVDIIENRLIKAALARLARLRLRSARTRRVLAILNQAFDAVTLTRFDPRNLPDVIFTRLNDRYRPAIELAKLILRSTSYDLWHGGVRASAFLMDMNQVFEDFVVTALRETLRLSARSFPQESRGHSLRLDQAGVIHLYPDISWWDGPQCRFVGDVKYKRIDIDGAKNSDLYQILSYCVAANLPNGMLIYAHGEAEQVTHAIVHLGKRIEVRTLDLSGAPDQILGQIGHIADRVRAISSSPHLAFN